MKERLGWLAAWIWSKVVATARFAWSVVCWAGRALGRGWSLLGLASEARARRRERAEALEQLGKMVYLLYKRSLVRNHDLLAECEKVAALDVELDRLGARADAVRLAPAGPADVSPSVVGLPADTGAGL